MDNEKDIIIKYACKYRDAIIEARNNNSFLKWPMNRFPYGCCDDASDLLAQYLLSNNIYTKKVYGVYRDDDLEHTCSHVWLKYKDLILDITGDQFKYCDYLLNYDIPVYVDHMDEFHKLFKIDKIECNKGINGLGEASHQRMWDLYNTIINYLD